MPAKFVDMKKLILWLAGILYFGSMAYVIFFLPRRSGVDVQFMRSVANLTPVIHKIQFWTSPIDDPRYIYRFFEDFIGNILMFMPYPFFLYFLFDIKNKFSILLYAFTLSSGIELVQYIRGIGVTDIDDVLLNTFGAYLGILLVQVFRKWKWAMDFFELPT